MSASGIALSSRWRLSWVECGGSRLRTLMAPLGSWLDAVGEGQEIAVPAGGKLRAVEAVKAWLAAAGITEGPVFRPVAKGGRVLPVALRAESVAAIVKAYAERAGLDPTAYAGHSLRAGFLASAAEHGASVFKMMEVSRDKSVDTPRGYVRRADLFRDHAGASFL
jgi:hypothetical protein